MNRVGGRRPDGFATNEALLIVYFFEFTMLNGEQTRTRGLKR